MKICIIYDRKGKVPVFVGLSPAVEVFIRELTIACKNDSDLVYNLYPDDYVLICLELGVGKGDITVLDEVNFTDFIKKDVKNG